MRVNPFYKFLSAEDLEHIRVVNYIRDKLPEIVAFHVPMEGKKSSYERYRHSIMGNLKGIMDFVFLHPKYKSNLSTEVLYHGLVIELKAPEHNRVVKKGKDAGKIVKSIGKLSNEQAELIEKLNKMGFLAECCFGADEAIKIIDEYFKDFYELQKITKKNKFKLMGSK
jgi:hypothetical protein